MIMGHSLPGLAHLGAGPSSVYPGPLGVEPGVPAEGHQVDLEGGRAPVLLGEEAPLRPPFAAEDLPLPLDQDARGPRAGEQEDKTPVLQTFERTVADRSIPED